MRRLFGIERNSRHEAYAGEPVGHAADARRILGNPWQSLTLRASVITRNSSATPPITLIS